MDTRQLAAFCAVVERRSFSQAAARLGVTQPAVSLQIRALEERLGQRLLDRSGRRVGAAPAARPGPPSAGRPVSLDGLRGGPRIVMQEGAGVRQVIEDELRATGTRLRDLEPKLELGLQESVRSAVRAGHGVTFISRSAVEADLDAGTIATARVEGLEPAREISLVRAARRSPTRLADAVVAFARARLA